ncbi:hypothetical protein K440DRAFT_600018 [Wilcoxina mikolae CBS 423.85]|nr:hypothetical protein K440DRAFT_600018 [Wilcoxina mikolae CBS 423.85]
MILKVVDLLRDEDLWSSLLAAARFSRYPDLVLIIDGIDCIEDQTHAFVSGINDFQQRYQDQDGSRKIKVLLTSGTQCEHVVKPLLEGVPWIKYDAERQEYLYGLRFDNTRYDKIGDEYKGTLEWIWSHEQYRRWSSLESSALLYLEGKIGSGKSTLTRYLKDHLLEREAPAKSAVIASYFYSSREGSSQISHYNMLRSILYDVLDQDEFFFYHFQSEYRQYKAFLRLLGSGRGHDQLIQWHYQSLQRILRSIRDHQENKRLYLIIDAVDESGNEDRHNILKLLFELCSNRSGPTTIKVFVASRPVVELEVLISATHNVIRMQDMNGPGIQQFVYSFCQELHLSVSLTRQIAEYILENAQGMFLWVHLVRSELIRYIELGLSKRHIFEFLTSLPMELEVTYIRVLRDIEQRASTLTVKLFEWVLFAQKRLRVCELQHALAISDSSETPWSVPSEEYFNDGLIMNMERRIIYEGGNLLELKGREEPIVQLIHQTVREFFLREDGYIANSSLRVDRRDSHLRITVTCLRYLTFVSSSQHTALPVESWTATNFEAYILYLERRPLILYALRHLREHMNVCIATTIVPELVAGFIKAMTSNEPALYLFQPWVASDLNEIVGDGGSTGAAVGFRVTMMRVAREMNNHRVVEILSELVRRTALSPPARPPSTS